VTGADGGAAPRCLSVDRDASRRCSRSAPGRGASARARLAALVLTSTSGFFAIGHHGQSDVMVRRGRAWGALMACSGLGAPGYARSPARRFYACVAGRSEQGPEGGLLGLAAGFDAVAIVDGWRDTGSATAGSRSGGPQSCLLEPCTAPTSSVTDRRSWATPSSSLRQLAFRRGARRTDREASWVLADALPWTIFSSARRRVAALAGHGAET